MDIKLNYIEKGEGKPLILLHGNGEDSSCFVHQIEYFSKAYRVIAVETRGHGSTPRGDAEFTIAQFAEDLFEFMNEHDIIKPHILGFSDGGNIALSFALKHPQRVDRLILNGANLNPTGVKRRFQIPIILAYRLVSHIAKKKPEAKRDVELLNLMVELPDISADELSGIHIRTLVIAGTRDMIKRRHTELIYRSLPDAKLEFIRGNHFIANKNFMEYNAAVEKFLNEP